MNDTKTKLDNLFKQLYPQGIQDLTAIETVIRNYSVTKVPNEAMAFNLQPICAGNLIPVSKPKRKHDGDFLWRGLIGYTLANKMVDNHSLFNHSISAIINQGLMELELHGMNNDEYELFVHRPGKTEEYFRDCENAAAYELRIYARKKIKELEDYLK